MMELGLTATWSPGPLGPGQSRLTAAATLLAEARVALMSAGSSTGWTGTAADEAVARHAELSRRLTAFDEALGQLGSALARAADRLALLVATVRLAELARVTSADPLGIHPATNPDRRAVTQLAEDVDAELASALSAVVQAGARAPEARAAAPVAPSRPARSGSAAFLAAPVPIPTGDVRTWWAALSPAEQDTVVTQRPDLVGSADGLPAWARDRANRLLLVRAETELTGQVADLEPGPRTWWDRLDGGPGLAEAMTIGTFGGGARRLAQQQAVAKLAAVRATREVLEQPDGRPRQLVTFDVRGRGARVAVAVGDLDRAGHVAVVVPGFTTTVERDLVGSDRVAADLRSAARTEADLIGDPRDVAVVSWLGYDAPQAADTLRSGRSVVLRASAEAGAASLAGFLRGLPPDRHVTLVGHSYGSTTAGLAVAGGDTRVDDLVVAGSPGVGADSSDQLGLPARRVHVLEADDDPVADLGWFGRDPDRLPGVDRLSTTTGPLPDGSTGRSSAGHSQYLAAGTTSQWNVAAVVVGAPTVPAARPPVSW